MQATSYDRTEGRECARRLLVGVRGNASDAQTLAAEIIADTVVAGSCPRPAHVQAYRLLTRLVSARAATR